ncbi:MAG TPA: glycosyltransferase [Pyrinomonadaceae bacterium]
MGRPRASIIITTHSRPRLLLRAIESARASGTDVEIIVVDDASSDQTATLCRALAAEITYVRVDRNQGVAGARNIGILTSRGEYLSFLDDDDTRLPGSLDKQIAKLEAVPEAAFVYGQAIVGDQDGRPGRRLNPTECPEGDIFLKLLTRNFIPCGTAVIRRSCLSRAGLLDNSIAGPDDWDLWIRLSELFPVIAVAEPVIIWRQSNPASGQGTSQTARLVSMGVRQFQKWLTLPRMSAVTTSVKRALWRSFSERMAERLLWDSLRALARARLIQVGKNLATIGILHPLVIPRVIKNRLFSEQRAELLSMIRSAMSGGTPDSPSRG